MVSGVSNCWRLALRFDIHGRWRIGFAVERGSIDVVASLDADDVSAIYLVLHRARSSWSAGDWFLVLSTGNTDNDGPTHGNRTIDSSMATDFGVGVDTDHNAVDRVFSRSNFSRWHFMARQDT